MTFLMIKGTSGGLLSCRYCALFNSQTSLTMVFVGTVWLGCMHNVTYWNESSLHALSECILILLMVRISLLESCPPRARPRRLKASFRVKHKSSIWKCSWAAERLQSEKDSFMTQERCFNAKGGAKTVLYGYNVYIKFFEGKWYMKTSEKYAAIWGI